MGTTRTAWLAASVLCAATLAVQAQQPPQSQARDPLAPRTSADSAATGPLHTVTICTDDLATSLRLYRDGLGLRVRGPLAVPDQVRQVQNGLWGMSPSERWTLYMLDRPATEHAVRVRLLVFDRPGPAIRQTWDPREPGPFTLGFPTTNLPALDAAIRALGFASLAPMEQSQIPRPDGSKYGLMESVFKGPDKVHAVGVSRLDDMPQLGPVDPATGHGGPAYSAQVVVNSDAVIAFYRDVLGLELRSDRAWKSGPTSAIGLPAGTAFRLALLYSPGASTGQLLLMDFRDGTAAPSGVAPRPPSRGIGVYSFPVRSLDATAARVRAANGVKIVSGPLSYDSPDLGPHRAMSVLAPNGVVVELFEPTAARR
jgi:catechol 2,3-dioxygenase-like lactoylglutathione lyase family enzyme